MAISNKVFGPRRSWLQAASVSPVSCRQKAARRKNSGSSSAFKHSSRAVSEAGFHISRSICAVSVSSNAARNRCTSGGSACSSYNASSASPNSSHPAAARNDFVTTMKVTLGQGGKSGNPTGFQNREARSMLEPNFIGSINSCRATLDDNQSGQHRVQHERNQLHCRP